MRILQILPSLNDGGVERGVVESNREYVKRGHESWVISLGGKQVSTIEADGGHHVCLDVKSKNPLTAPWRALKLRKLIRQIQPDILHYRSRIPGWLTHWANAAKDLHLPMVSTMHGLNSVSWYSHIMVDADRVICVSSKGYQYIQDNYQVDPGIIRTIPRGIDDAFFAPEAVDSTWQKEFVAKHGLEGRWVASAVGRVSELKGYEILIQAVAELHTQWPELTAVIVGAPQQGQEAYERMLRAMVKEKGIEANVIFAGSQKQVREIYALSNVVCSCNTKKPESFGRTVAEAMAMNTPVIAAAHGGVLDIIEDGKTGWLVPPGDIHALATALQKVRTTSLTGLREHILQHFTLTTMVDATLAVYNELVQTK